MTKQMAKDDLDVQLALIAKRITDELLPICRKMAVKEKPNEPMRGAGFTMALAQAFGHMLAITVLYPNHHSGRWVLEKRDGVNGAKAIFDTYLALLQSEGHQFIDFRAKRERLGERVIEENDHD
jgi:hypothetical protein